MNEAVLLEALRRVSRPTVVLVVGDIKLKLHHVQVLHALVKYGDDWSYERLGRYCRSEYGGNWDKVKAYRTVKCLRAKGFITAEGIGTVREAVGVVAERQLHDPHTGRLWREIHDILKGYDDLGMSELLRQLRGLV